MSVRLVVLWLVVLGVGAVMGQDRGPVWRLRLRVADDSWGAERLKRELGADVVLGEVVDRMGLEAKWEVERGDAVAEVQRSVGIEAAGEGGVFDLVVRRGEMTEAGEMANRVWVGWRNGFYEGNEREVREAMGRALDELEVQDDVAPRHEGAKRLLAELRESDDPMHSPEFKVRVAEIERLLGEGKAELEAGDLYEARRRFDEVLEQFGGEEVHR